VVLAVREADPAAVGVIVGGVPVVLALAAPLAQRRRPARRLLAAAVVVSLGAAAAQGLGGATTPEAVLLSLGALASEACFSLLAAPILPRLGPVRVSLYACLAAAAELALVGLGVDGRAALPPPSPAVAAAIAYLAVATVVAFVSWYTSIGRIGVARTGLFAGLVPVGTWAAALAVAPGPPRPLEVIGTFVAAGGVALGLAPGRGWRRGELPPEL
jgi:drug/metabolite transporter (DMT)-like permease